MRRSGLLPCGKRYATEAEAASSRRGQRAGAVVRRCLNPACGGFHVKNTPVPARAVPSQSPRRRPALPASVRLAARTRAGCGDPDNAHCESCGCWLGRYGGDVQRRLAGNTEGSRGAVMNGASNAAVLCRRCSELAEARDGDMEARGWRIRHGNGPEHDPRLVPVARVFGAGEQARLLLLTQDGLYSLAGLV